MTAVSDATGRLEGREARRRAILEAVAAEALRTQHDIVRALERRGIHATQVSVSRDIVELGLVKAGGCWRHSPSATTDPELPLRAWVRRAEAAGPNLVVVQCEAGTAPAVGQALDRAVLAGVVGTVAGDDTLFLATASARASAGVLRYLRARIQPVPGES
jgi:transcriptional regulator of arginine metabolism